ncbi:hypothetical protein L218DRAFT_1019662 [Marasmius fiardii PR-910]|nr:hypothetical protein L218DRAFT_1019662 [Marasmius fiardii PR-910]
MSLWSVGPNIDGTPTWKYWHSHVELVKDVCLLLHDLVMNVDIVQLLETVQDILDAFDPSRASLLIDLLLAEIKSSNSNQEHIQKCIKFLGLLVKKNNVLPPSLLVQDEICTLVNLDLEAADSILSALEPSKLTLVFELLLVKCMRLLEILVKKHSVSLFVQDGIHRLVELEPAIADTILAVLEPSKVSSILDPLLAEGKIALEYHRKCRRLSQILIRKHKIMPPSLVSQDGIRTLVDLDPETTESILFALESSTIPPVLDVLLSEAKTLKLNHEYRQKFNYAYRYPNPLKKSLGYPLIGNSEGCVGYYNLDASQTTGFRAFGCWDSRASSDTRNPLIV